MHLSHRYNCIQSHTLYEDFRQFLLDKSGTSPPPLHLKKRDVLLTQYCADGKIEKSEMGGACGAYGEGRGVHRVPVGKPEGKRSLGRPRRRWEDNIKMYLQEVGEGCADWMELAQDRERWRVLLSTAMNFRVP